LHGWKLEIQPATLAAGEAWITLAGEEALSETVDGVFSLAGLDPAAWANGVYRLRLTAWDVAGRTTERETRVVVDSAVKQPAQALHSDVTVQLDGHAFSVRRELPQGGGAGEDFGNWRLSGLDTRLTHDQASLQTPDGQMTGWRNGARVWLQTPVLAGSAAPENLRFTLNLQPETLAGSADAPVVWHPVFESSLAGWTLTAQAADEVNPDSAVQLQRQGSRLYEAPVTWRAARGRRAALR